MNDEEYKYYEQQMRENELRSSEARSRNIQQEMMLRNEDKSMISEQLSLEEDLIKIYYLLRGYSQQVSEELGELVWVKPTDNNMIVLTEYGVNLIENTIAWYVNKNTLLSNYDDVTINVKMEDFSNALNDAIFMKYEKVFKYPSLQDCKKELDERVKRKKEVRIYTLELLKKEVNDEEKQKIEMEILKELEPVIEREIEKIRQQIMKDKLKEFELIIRKVQDVVHSAYLRAWKGQERSTLRQHTHISETRGSFPLPQQKTGGPLSFFRRGG